jgi:Sulfotransferase family
MAGSGDTAPIMVTGINRAGTTWVGRTLARSPRVGLIYEPLNPRHRPGIFRAQVPWWFMYVRDDPPEGLVDAMRRTLGFRYSHAAELRSLRSLRDAGRMARDAALFSRWRARGYRPLVKDPIAVLSAPWLAREFGMRVVVMIRHPAAYVVSMRRLQWTHDFAHFRDQPGLVDDLVPELRTEIDEFARRPADVIDQAALLWKVIHTVIDEYRRSHPEWLFVRHEDISADPETGFRILFQQLGLSWTTGVSRFVAETTAAHNPAEARQGTVHQLHRDSAASVRMWHRRLEAREIARIRARTEPIASAFYSESDWAVSEPGRDESFQNPHP